MLAVKHPGSRRQPCDPVEPTASSSAKRLGHTTDFDGNYYHLNGARNEPKGPQRDVRVARCADIGRDPKEIIRSSHLRLDQDRNYGRVIEKAAGLAAEGLDLGIVYISPPHDPTVLETLAEAIRDSGLWDQ